MHFKRIRITLAHFGHHLVVLFVLIGLLLDLSKDSVMKAPDNLGDAASRELAEKSSLILTRLSIELGHAELYQYFKTDLSRINSKVHSADQ